jgi:glycosyltransferase involved in cell wall biosynthesis
MNGPKRVLQVFARMDRGGAETMIMNLYRNIDRTKVQFDFIVHANEKCDYDDEIISLGGRIFRVPRFSCQNIFEYITAWNNLFKENQEYKLIHAHVRSTASIFLWIAKKKYRLNTIAHSHSTSSGNGLNAIIKNLLQYPIRYIADYLFACNVESGIWLFGNKKSKSVKILKNSIDTNLFKYNNQIRAEVRTLLNIEDKFVLGHIGRFDEPKNHEFLIDIFAEVYKLNNKSVLLLVGKGDLENKIRDKVKKKGLDDSVLFLGVRSDVHQLLQVMDVFIFPSLYEGLPVTLIEAQSSGIPCIVSSEVSNEVQITNNIEFISLNNTVSYWTDNILKYKDSFTRIDTSESIISAGYDVKENAKWIQDFYLNEL